MADEMEQFANWIRKQLEQIRGDKILRPSEHEAIRRVEEGWEVADLLKVTPLSVAAVKSRLVTLYRKHGISKG